MILLHGLSDCARSFVPLIAHLTDSFTCIAYELPTGDQDRAALASIRHVDLAADLFALLDHLQIAQASLYGASFGATIALSALHARPRRFLRAAMHGAFAYRRIGPGERVMLQLLRNVRGKLKDVRLFRRLQRRADAGQFETAPADTWQFQQANTGETPIRAFIHRARMMQTLDLRPRLPAITHPILLIRGDDDRVVSRESMDELAEALPHADRLEFSHCGHHPHYTHAAGLAESLRRFLAPPCGL